MSNKVAEPIFTKKPWGSEIIWTVTAHYMAKTIEVAPYKITDLIVYERKEKSIIVILNTLILGYGSCCDEDEMQYLELPEGWTHYIPPGHLHRYGATDKPVRLIEISSPHIDEGIVITNLGEIFDHEP